MALIVAHTNPGWRFVGWMGDASGSGTSKTLVMDGDKQVVAKWEQVQSTTYTLTVSANPSNGAGGYVEIVNGEGNIPGERDFSAGDVALIVAHTNPGWRFVGWRGDASGGGTSKTLVMDGDKQVVARWEQEQSTTYTLTVSANPSNGAGGYVEIVNGEGNIPGERDFSAGDVALIVAHTNPGWRFVGWRGDASGGGTSKTLVMDGDKQVVARWEQVQSTTYTLTVSANPSNGAGGYVEIVNGEGNIPGERDFSAGDVALIVAHTNPGWRFVGWMGDASGGGTSKTLVMDGDKQIVARWEQVQSITYTLYVEATPNDGSGGYVEVHNGSGNTSGQRVFNAGEYANLEARPNSGWRFVRWEVDASGTNKRASLLMNRDKRVRAVFQPQQSQVPQTFTLTVKSASSSGVVRFKNGNWDDEVQRTFDVGQTAEVEAQAWVGACFSYWTGSWNSSWRGYNSAVTLSLEGAGTGTITAHFVPCSL